MSELNAYIAPTADGTGLAEYYLKSEADKVIAYHKYKRCLAMAKWCNVTALFYGNNIPQVLNKDITDSRRQKVFRRLKHYKKWHRRWLELAEKFKEAK